MNTSNNSTFNSLAALALDLKRVSLGLQRGSLIMTQNFIKEALLRREEVDFNDIDIYIRKILKKLPDVFKINDVSKKAEDILMYSILLQNYVNKKYKYNI